MALAVSMGGLLGSLQKQRITVGTTDLPVDYYRTSRLILEVDLPVFKQNVPQFRGYGGGISGFKHLFDGHFQF